MPIPNLDDPILRHARTDLLPLRAGQTVGEALAQMRAHPPEGRIVYFYVVDDNQRLCGVVPTRRILLSPLDATIERIMVTKVVSIPAHASVLDACELFTLHKLLALPVVDNERHFLGAVDIELYTDEILDITQKSSFDDVFQLIGFRLAEARTGTSLHAFLVRFPWLTCNVAGGILAAILSGYYEPVLTRHLALALFIPAVLSLSESISIQSVSLAIDALHGGRHTRGLASATRRELSTGLLLGVACGIIVGLAALAWHRQGPLALALAVAIAIAMSSAAVIGLGLPHAMRTLRQDPRVASGPIALVVADLVTLVIYFTTANWLLG